MFVGIVASDRDDTVCMGPFENVNDTIKSIESYHIDSIGDEDDEDCQDDREDARHHFDTVIKKRLMTMKTYREGDISYTIRKL